MASGIETISTSEKLYTTDHGDSSFLKRALWPHEYKTRHNGETCVPFHVNERLENEAACIRYIRQHTDIPVPEILDAFDNDGSYHLRTKFVHGVEMNTLTRDEQIQVLPQVRRIVATLRTLQGQTSGGPSGILAPPCRVLNRHPAAWRTLSDGTFVFCHCDLHQGNILVDPKTLEITAVLDWEHAGFYPREHEIPFYERPENSGKQVSWEEWKPTLQRIEDFWRLSQVSATNQTSVPSSRESSIPI